MLLAVLAYSFCMVAGLDLRVLAMVLNAHFSHVLADAVVQVNSGIYKFDCAYVCTYNMGSWT